VTSLPRPCLMLVTEPSPRLPEIVTEAVAGGVNVVQWRDKVTPKDELRPQIKAMYAAVGGALLVVNGPPALARIWGRHLPSSGGSFRFLQEHLGDRLAFGRSVHSVASAHAAAGEGADYIVAGTIFASQSHPDIPPAGLDFLRDVCAAVSIPVLAIGGVTPENAADCIHAGAAGVAVLSPIMRAADPRAIAQTYRTALDAAWEERECSLS